VGGLLTIVENKKMGATDAAAYGSEDINLSGLTGDRMRRAEP